MKSSAFDRLLGAFEDALSENGAGDLAAQVQVLRPLFAASSLSVAARLEAWPRPDAAPGPAEARADAVAKALSRWTHLVETIGGKAAIKDFKALLAALRAREGLAFDAGVTQAAARAPAPEPDLDEAVVAKHVAALETDYRDPDTFAAAMDALRTDPDVRRAEAVAIASAFVYRQPGGTTKTAALAAIEKKHETFLASAAKSRAMRGRSAA